MKEKMVNKKLETIAQKVFSSERISIEDGLSLYAADLGFLGELANFVREKKNGKNVYYNRNIHIEPTNICIYNCKFCSYSHRKIEAFELSLEQIISLITEHEKKGITEVHIVGSVHPERDIDYYGNIIHTIKTRFPAIHIKAFSAVELDYFFKKNNLSISDGLLKLKEYGLDSIPGGGAEIFDETLRSKICGEKTKTETWLAIHETAHRLGIPSNATMLYGHYETYAQRIDHINRLRLLQDRTKGFNVFIPLKYRNKNNDMSEVIETTIVEDLKNYAVSRIFLDNFNHIKAYWPMIGKHTAQVALAFGVDDMDGTIDDTTKIYSAAGAEDQKPSLNTQEFTKLIEDAGFIAVERNSVYDII